MRDALARQDASVIKAYGALLVDVARVPGMEKWLPRLMTPNSVREISHGAGLNAYALFAVSRAANAPDVIEAYHAAVVHPNILPYIQDMLPELLVGESTSLVLTQLHLMEGLLNPQLPGYHAYCAMIMDPNILPHILNELPSVLREKVIEAGIVESGAVVVTEHASQAGRSIRKRAQGFFRSFFQRIGS
jgi:hypothetical protein